MTSAHEEPAARSELREAQLSEAQSLAELGSFEWEVGRKAASWSHELYRICKVDEADFEPTLEGVRALLHPDEVPWLSREVESALGHGRPIHVEHRIVRPDGCVRVVESRLKAVVGSDVGPTRLIGACQDVTEQRIEAQERRKAERRFQTAFECAPIGIALMAPDGRCLEVNHALCEITGYSEQTLVGASFEQFTHPEDVDAEWLRLQRMLEGETENSRVDRRYLDAGGQTVFVRVSASVVREPDGSPLYLIVQVEDITERGRTERALRESREQLRALLENTAAAVYLKDLEGRYLVANGVAAAVAGRTPDEFVGKTDEELFPEEVARQLRAFDLKAVDAGAPIAFEEQMEVEERTHTYLSQKFVLRDEHGAPYATGGISTDISERVRVEDENRRLENQVHRFERLETVGRLAGGIAHDFNNLLAVIINYSALAAEELSPGSDVRHDISEIQKAADRAASLTHQLLAFSRQESIEPEVLDLNGLVADTGVLLRSTLGENVELVLAGSANLWSVEAGSDQLQRILLNLALNARDAMPRGGTVTVTTDNAVLTRARMASLVEPIPSGNYACLSLADTGEGMSEDVATRAFEPFFSTKPSAEAAGLGLASVYGLVRQMRGGIELETSPLGTTVHIFLPVTDRPPSPPMGEIDEGGRAGNGETILVVEDEEAMLAPVARVLTRSGYDVVVGTPEVALAEAERRDQPIDLLLTDVVMPSMSGIELAERLTDRQPELRVLLMSGYTDEVVLGHDLAAGEHPLLAKPFTPAQLLKAVAGVLGRPVGPPVRTA